MHFKKIKKKKKVLFKEKIKYICILACHQTHQHCITRCTRAKTFETDAPRNKNSLTIRLARGVSNCVVHRFEAVASCGRAVSRLSPSVIRFLRSIQLEREEKGQVGKTLNVAAFS